MRDEVAAAIRTLAGEAARREPEMGDGIFKFHRLLIDVAKSLGAEGLREAMDPAGGCGLEALDAKMGERSGARRSQMVRRELRAKLGELRSLGSSVDSTRRRALALRDEAREFDREDKIRVATALYQAAVLNLEDAAEFAEIGVQEFAGRMKRLREDQDSWLGMDYLVDDGGT